MASLSFTGQGCLHQRPNHEYLQHLLISCYCIFFTLIAYNWFSGWISLYSVYVSSWAWMWAHVYQSKRAELRGQPWAWVFISPFIEAGSHWCLSVQYIRLAGLWAPKDSPVSTSHPLVGGRSKQINSVSNVYEGSNTVILEGLDGGKGRKNRCNYKVKKCFKR